MSTDHTPPLWPILLFCSLVLALGIPAGLNYSALQGLGGLLFILSPLLATVIARTLSHDFRNAGFDARPAFRRPGGARVFLSALLLFPALFALTAALGAALGQITFTGGVASQLAVSFLTALPGVALYAFSEEVAWRGYLDPALARRGLSLPRRTAVVASVWGLWHLGYILAGVNGSPLPLALYLPLFLLACFAMALIYAIWRARTGSFWPAWMAHAVANAFAWPVIEGDLMRTRAPLVFDIRPEALLPLTGLCGAALWLWRQHARARTLCMVEGTLASASSLGGSHSTPGR